jgi:hypothetical protein
VLDAVVEPDELDVVDALDALDVVDVVDALAVVVTAKLVVSVSVTVTPLV